MISCCLLSVLYYEKQISIGCKQGWLRQNRSIETLIEPELACPPSVVPVLMQLHAEQGRNISLRCAVSGQWNTVMVHFLTLTYANSHHQNNSNSLRTQRHYDKSCQLQEICSAGKFYRYLYKVFGSYIKLDRNLYK